MSQIFTKSTGGGSGTVVNLEGNTGGTVPPNGSGTIFVPGDVHTILANGNAGTNTITYTTPFYISATIDLTVTTSTLLFTTLNNGRFYVPSVITGYCNTSISVSANASITIGTNATDYDNVVQSSELGGVGFMLANDFVSIAVDSAMGFATAIPPNTQVFVNVVDPATATAQTMTFYFQGYYV